MVNIDEIFKSKVPIQHKLTAYGFKENGLVSEYRCDIMNGQFIMLVSVANGQVDYFIYDAVTGDEYTLVKVDSAVGSFIGDVRTAAEEKLCDIAEMCFEVGTFRSPQTNRILSHIAEEYSRVPEFLWENDYRDAVLRHEKSGKWFAVIMTVNKSKIVPQASGTVEIMDLKAAPQTVEMLTENSGYYKAYHMNKKHWYTVILDGSLEDGELLCRIRDSFEITASIK